MLNRTTRGTVLILAWGLAVRASLAAPPYEPTDVEITAVASAVRDLTAALELLPADVDDELRADVDVFHAAAGWFLRYPEEVYHKSYVARILTVLARGLVRAKELAAGKPTWPHRKGRIARAYRSRIDGSVQPYGLVIPESYDGKTPVRLDVVLHGRNGKLTEGSFLAKHDSDKPAPVRQKHIELHVFGRTNNAYRWAGEVDVFEALASVEKRYRIDPKRIVLRGFSMGGAGAWHLGLHHPSRWAVVEAGAGFSDTVVYAKLRDVRPHWKRSLHIYDAVDYSLNAFNVPIVGYGGEIDKQLQASVNVRESLTAAGFGFVQKGLDWELERAPLATSADLRALFLVGPSTGHKFHPDSKRRSEAFIAEQLARERDTPPDRVRFVTYTVRYGRCHWISVEELGEHYARAEVDARFDAGRETIEMTTRNVAALSIDCPGKVARVRIDGDRIDRPAGSRRGLLRLRRSSGHWQSSKEAPGGLVKRPGLQGPIDDAFTDSFLVVSPTGDPIRPRFQELAHTELDRLRREFPKWLRGNVRVVTDKEASLEDTKHNLILFGDPSSHRLIAEAMKELPIHWDHERLEIGVNRLNARDFYLAFIYPNPKSPNRYIVVNSGHTFGEKEFHGTNAYLFPRLGDWAIFKPLPDGTSDLWATGFFDERWQP